MVYVVLVALLLVLIFGPAIWVRSILAKHGADRPDFPGTGGELAEHLLEWAGIDGVAVEATDLGDHYDPQSKAVRLAPENKDGRSLTAVVTAAHEVGHAVQDHMRYGPLAWRSRLVKSAMVTQKIGVVAMLAIPVVAALTHAPGAGLLTFLAGLLMMATSIAAHLITLPVEFDASFGKALPMLQRGRFLPVSDLAPARRILLACALTYVAAALSSLLNVARWIAILRR